MLKVIISHDVDHLYAKEHWFRDMVYPKLWIRSTLNLIQRKITFMEWWGRCTSCFKKERNHIEELTQFDAEHGVESTFFFGMNQGLGMSYLPREAKAKIMSAHNKGFATGVHGIEYQNQMKMQTEYDTFTDILGFEPCGIRMHYVRFDEETFYKEAEIGYAFDSTEFDKNSAGTCKAPYKVKNMWEFPLAIMDGYLPIQYDKAKEATLRTFKRFQEQGIDYITILFHDDHFSKEYQTMKRWYCWLIEYIAQSDELTFISFKDAMRELEEANG